MAGIPTMMSSLGGMDILTESVKSFFKYEDKNGDGIITEEEFQSPPNEPDPEELPEEFRDQVMEGDEPEEIEADNDAEDVKDEL